MTAPKDDPLAPRERTPSISFRNAPPGTWQVVRVLEYATTTQARDFDTGEPKWWDKEKTQPVMSVVIKVCDSNGEARSLWAQNPSGMYNALVEAQQSLGNGRRISPGDMLRITFTHEVPNPDKPHLNPQKQYQIAIRPHDPLAQPNGQQVQQQQVQPAQPAFVPPQLPGYPPPPQQQPVYQPAYQQAPLPPYEPSQPQQQPARQPAGFTDEPPF